jgi:hypothetical protein
LIVAADLKIGQVLFVGNKIRSDEDRALSRISLPADPFCRYDSFFRTVLERARRGEPMVSKLEDLLPGLEKIYQMACGR